MEQEVHERLVVDPEGPVRVGVRVLFDHASLDQAVRPSKHGLNVRRDPLGKSVVGDEDVEIVLAAGVQFPSASGPVAVMVSANTRLRNSGPNPVHPDALSDVRSMLALCETGAIRCSVKTLRPTVIDALAV